MLLRSIINWLNATYDLFMKIFIEIMLQ